MVDHYDSGNIIIVDGNTVFKYNRVYDLDKRPVFAAPSHEVIKPQSKTGTKPGFVYEKYPFLNIDKDDFKPGHSQYGFQYIFYRGDITTVGIATEEQLTGICDTNLYMDLSRILYHISESNEVVIDRKYDLPIPVQEYGITTDSNDLPNGIITRVAASITFFNQFYEDREV